MNVPQNLHRLLRPSVCAFSVKEPLSSFPFYLCGVNKEKTNSTAGWGTDRSLNDLCDVL